MKPRSSFAGHIVRRIAAVALPRVRLELARSSEDGASQSGGVMAVVVARPGGAVKDERSLLGNTRLDEVSPEAFALGVRPGQTIAAARAKVADLSVRVVPEGAVVGALARLAEALLAFGATTSVSAADDVVWVDFTGCAHLRGGEEPLAHAIALRVRECGHACRLAVADGPRIAAQMAWFSRNPVVIAKPGEGARVLGLLPVSALPVDGETLRWLKSSGMRTVGDVQALPRRELGTRLGPNAAEVLALLEGDDRAPLVPYVPPEVPEERVELEYGITGTDALLFVAKRLCTQLAARLVGRGMGATRLELVLALDRALVRPQGCEEKKDPRRTLALSLPSPLSAAPDLLAVLRAKLESFVVPAPVLAATLRAIELAPRGARALDLFVPEARADRELPRLLAELSAELGPSAVGTLALANRWAPEERSVLVPFGTPREKLPRFAALEHSSSAPAPEEPTRLLLHSAKPLATSPRVEITHRLEAVEWWRSGRPARKDYGHAWIDAVGSSAWVEVADERGIAPVSPSLRGWVD